MTVKNCCVNNSPYKLYVASNGAEFLDKAECHKYEKTLRDPKAAAIAKNIPSISTYAPYGSKSGVDWIWRYLQSREEFCAVMEYEYNIKYPKGYRFPKSQQFPYPCWVCFADDGCGSYRIHGTMEDVQRNMDLYLSSVENEIKNQMTISA